MQRRRRNIEIPPTKDCLCRRISVLNLQRLYIFEGSAAGAV